MANTPLEAKPRQTRRSAGQDSLYMTKLSRWPIEKEKMSLFLDDFWTAVASLRSKTEARLFFNQFLTHTERKMFAKRFQVAMMLILGYDYNSINHRLRVSAPTIAKISNWLEENREALIVVAKRIIKLKEKKMTELEFKKRSIKGRAGGVSVVEEVFDGVAKNILEIRKQNSLKN